MDNFIAVIVGATVGLIFAVLASAAKNPVDNAEKYQACIQAYEPKQCYERIYGDEN